MADSSKRRKVVQIDQHSMQSMKVLNKKFGRDYLKFFTELSSLYIAGKNKKEIDKTIRLIEKVQGLLNDVIEEGAISVPDSELLYNLVQQIEEQKKYFLEEVENVQALQEKVSKVEEGTGVSLEDLNVTREVAREGVRQARRREKESTTSFLKRTAPTAYGMGASAVQALGVSTLGPFYGAAKAGLGLLKDAGGVRKSLSEKKESALEESLKTSLRPGGGMSPDFEGAQTARTQPPPVSDFRGTATKTVSLEKQTEPLREFFDKGAYKAQWTRELLNASKEKSKGADGGGLLGGLGLGGLTASFKGLGAGLLPLIGKAGLLAALAVGVGLSIKQFINLGGAVSEFSKAKKAQAEAARGLKQAAGQKLDAIKEMGLAEYAKKTGKTEKQVAMDVAYMEQQSELTASAAQPWYKKTGQALGIIDRPKISSVQERTKEIQEMSAPRLKPGVVPEQPIPFEAGQIQTLTETMKNLTDKIGQTQSEGIPGPRQGNRFDSGDTLIQNHANGDLTLRE